MLTISHGDTKASIAPERGALVAGLTVAGREVLFLDRASFDDPTKNVRGGIPILFPYAGKLENGTFLAAGTKMGQHGFGRNKRWTPTEQTADALTVRLTPDDETRAVYPYEFVAEQTATVLPRGLQVDLLVGNLGTKPMPVSPGWHPYYCVPGAQKGAVTGDVPGFTPDKIGNDREFDFGLPAPANGRARFQVPGLGALCIRFSPEMRHMQFWSLPGKDFICLEPFFGPNNTVNTDRRLDLAPGAYRNFSMRIQIEPAG
ncbi:MAG: hypothetical protein HYZ53_08185 [Planctomycetes bacterium]|nr:hypothetical protein [Planctomycetota bacterium]